MIFARHRDVREKLVFDALSARADMTGGELSRVTGVRVGNLYPVLMRLEYSGRITSRWETKTPRAEGPLRRRFYALPAEVGRG
ncbi:hypothetical protein [Sphingomonas sp. 3-13AW]|uniref:hypothetical protein n=1 Tax=Sphingomonas sp. 3-13AW TaxID=3050450 RepID=UPI003BB71D29